MIDIDSTLAALIDTGTVNWEQTFAVTMEWHTTAIIAMANRNNRVISKALG